MYKSPYLMCVGVKFLREMKVCERLADFRSFPELFVV